MNTPSPAPADRTAIGPQPRSRGRRLGALALLAFATGIIGVGMSALGAPEDEFTEEDLSLRPSPDRGREEVMRLLARKERNLLEREKLVDKKEADLRAAQEEVEQRISELQGLRDELRLQLGDLDEDREARITHLVKMFEAMREKKAAAILEITEDTVALEVLERMKKDKAGKILGSMTPDRASELAESIGDAALTKDMQ
jgi:flagellar motility protein MotE (MotC chaperone)